LNTLLLRFANTGSPGLGGGTAEKAAPSLWKAAALSTTRMLDGKDEVVGVAGKTLTEELCGLRLIFMLVDAVGEAIEPVVDDVEDALE
jgi:hypothetical protein